MFCPHTDWYTPSWVLSYLPLCWTWPPERVRTVWRSVPRATWQQASTIQSGPWSVCHQYFKKSQMYSLTTDDGIKRWKVQREEMVRKVKDVGHLDRDRRTLRKRGRGPRALPTLSLCAGMHLVPMWKLSVRTVHPVRDAKTNRAN